MELANKVGASEIINRIVDDLKDENEQYRKMVMETIEKVWKGSVLKKHIYMTFENHITTVFVYPMSIRHKLPPNILAVYTFI